MAKKQASEKVDLSDDEWKKRLTSEEYEVLREKGTEWAFTGKYAHETKPGVYHCAGCGQPLFLSDNKYHSGTGWPSFVQPVNMQNIELHEDRSFFMTRTEVVCRNCGSHLGHVFDDGPRETTGQRYCINSVAL